MKAMINQMIAHTFKLFAQPVGFWIDDIDKNLSIFIKKNYVKHL